MKVLLFKLSAMAIVVGAQVLIPLQANDQPEGKASVPKRGDGQDAESEVYRASEVIGLPVKGDDGTEVGQIKDLVINGTTSEVLYAVVSMNEAKEKDSVYVMPWTVFQPSFNQGSVIQYTTLNVPRNVWLQAPFFPMAQFGQTPYRQWGPQVNDYYTPITSKAQANTPRDSGQDPKSDKSQATSPKTNAPKGDKPRAEASKNSEKPAANASGRAAPPKPKAEAPGTAPATNPKSPAPKATDPPEPKKPAPLPKEPKPQAPNLK